MWWTGRCREASGIGADGKIVWFWRAQARRSRRYAAPKAAWRRRWQFSTVHRGEHAISRNPLRREGRSVSAVPVVNARSRNLSCAGAVGAAGTRSSLRPLIFGRVMSMNNSGEMRRGNAESHPPLVMPRVGGASSNPRLLGSRRDVSRILDRPPSRTMTAETWDACIKLRRSHPR